MLCRSASHITTAAVNMGETTIYDIDFRDESVRMDSYLNWPSNAPVSAAALSRAGFFYTGEGRRVQCAYCHILIDDWTYADQAMRKHRDRNPDCEFVRDAYSDTRQQQQRRPSVSQQQQPARDVPPSLYLRESERRKTFVGWPVPFISTEDLARAGFVFLKHDDRVQCVFCLGVVGSWEQGDVPWGEHKRHFAFCPFVRNLDVGNVSIDDEYRGMVPRAASGSGGTDVVGRRTTSSPLEPSASSVTGMTNGELNILQHSPAKNPIYKTKEARLRTYGNWPSDIRQSPQSMAEAGFFYTGQMDHVKCFHCNGGLRNWEPDDDPWEEHARWFPNCEFISLNKGSEFVVSAKEHRRTTIEPQPVAGLSEEKLANCPAPITEQEIDHLLETELARQAMTSLQLEANKVRLAYRKRMQEVGYPFCDVESLVNAVLDLENSSEANGEETKFGEEQTPPEIGLKGGSSSTVRPATNGTGSQSLKGDDLDPRVCKICWDKDVCVVFLPCGHLASCAECASALKDCPFCRQQIKGTVKTYWP